MIRIRVVSPFPLERAGPDGEVELPDQTTVWQMIHRLHLPFYAYALPVSVNGEQAGKRRRLCQGDLVVFIMPYSGG